MEDGELAALVRTHPAIKLFSFFATIMTDNDDGAQPAGRNQHAGQ